ncbi:MAG: hypothetical protein HC845_11405 [Akkermansiaceae bacterium]|nr:hypothetical protein [Akkermansiaceae bacterium]
MLVLNGNQGTLHADVRAFYEDAADLQYAREKGDAAQNFSTLRRIALNFLKTETTKPKEPIRGKRIFAALDSSYLGSIIGLRQM